MANASKLLSGLAPDPFSDLDGFWGVLEIAKHYKKSEHSIRSDAVRAPWSLPPICRLPGHRQLLWRKRDVLAFDAAHVVTATQPAPPPVANRRGPRTKSERVRAHRTAPLGRL